MQAKTIFLKFLVVAKFFVKNVFPCSRWLHWHSVCIVLDYTHTVSTQLLTTQTLCYSIVVDYVVHHVSRVVDYADTDKSNNDTRQWLRRHRRQILKDQSGKKVLRFVDIHTQKQYLKNMKMGDYLSQNLCVFVLLIHYWFHFASFCTEVKQNLQYTLSQKHFVT